MQEPQSRLATELTERAHDWKAKTPVITVEQPLLRMPPGSQVEAAVRGIQELLLGENAPAIKAFVMQHPELGMHISAVNEVTFEPINLETIRQVFSLKNELLIHQGVVFGARSSFNNLTQLTANGYWGSADAPTYLASYQAALELQQAGFKEDRLAAKPNWMFAEDETNQAKLTLYVDPDLLGLHRHLYLDPETVLELLNTTNFMPSNQSHLSR